MRTPQAINILLVHIRQAKPQANLVHDQGETYLQ